MNTIAEVFGVFHSSTLQANLPPVRTRTRQVDSRQGVVFIDPGHSFP
jgi:N-acetylmuramoyl-L-alanine amidase